MRNIQKIKLDTHEDERGILSVIELQNYVDWPVKRVYYLSDVTLPRGGHAVKDEKKIYVCQKGSVVAKLHDGDSWYEFSLKGPNDAIIMNSYCYRVFEDFSKDAVLMALSSVNYNPDDYTYDFDEFLKSFSK